MIKELKMDFAQEILLIFFFKVYFIVLLQPS